MKPKKTKDMDDIRAEIREAGLRCTPTRIAVLQFANQRTSPFTHNDVVQALEGKGFESSTLFRTLCDFAERGLMNRMELGDHLYRYELARHESTPHLHAHFLCTDCGEVSCVNDARASLARKAAELMQNQSITEILFKGVCGTCLAK
jgi:Fur family ferric uptake transcriptional regulator